MTEPMSVDPFRARFPWKGGDLQTVRNALAKPAVDLTPWSEETLRFVLPDGKDGTSDVLIGQLARPEPGSSKAMVILIHGLTGCEDSVYVRATARHLLLAGFTVLRLNLRGAGPTLPLCHEQYHAGRTEDLDAVIRQLPPGLKGAGVCAVGYSLGGNMLLKYQGEQGSRTPIAAAVTVSAPIDLAATSQRFHRRRNYVYKRYLLDRMKTDAIAARGGLPAPYKAAVQQSRSIYEYDDVYIAPRYGFGTADAYYAAVSANRFMPAVRAPTLMIHALNDPWIASQSYKAFRWQDVPALKPLIQASGGHVGFHGQGSSAPWHDRQILEFFRRAA